MENHNFMISSVVNSFIHFCGNINDRWFGGVFFRIWKTRRKRSDKYTGYTDTNR